MLSYVIRMKKTINMSKNADSLMFLEGLSRSSRIHGIAPFADFFMSRNRKQRIT